MGMCHAAACLTLSLARGQKVLPVPALDDSPSPHGHPLPSEDVLFLERAFITWHHLIKDVLNAIPDTSTLPVRSMSFSHSLLGGHNDRVMLVARSTARLPAPSSNWTSGPAEQQTWA